jgi:hypothetical protein
MLKEGKGLLEEILLRSESRNKSGEHENRGEIFKTLFLHLIGKRRKAG